MHRRTFFAAAAAALAQEPAPDWGGPVLDIHLHPKAVPDGEWTHMAGCGVTHAVILGRVTTQDEVQARIAKHPGRMKQFVSTNVAPPAAGAIAQLRNAAGRGAKGFGEMKSQVDVDGPEMRAVFDLATELGVPVLMHFQEVTQPGSPGTFNMGLARLPAILKAYPKTTFIGHADFFWANISADVPRDNGYPTGPVKPGGLTDRLLAEHPNLYGDLSANSGRNALARDPDFSAKFLERHKSKLMFGCDCSCTDGRGAGQRSNQPLIAGKCVARETLTALRKLASPATFRRIAWENGAKLLGFTA
ncbi:MAG: amidohydrolase family protein [Bryobacteraceae bacterium]